jgi:hypothetical protein
VGSKDACRRVGANTPATAANWTMGRSFYPLNGAVCCK